ncbi:uncharacterized protein LOC125945371 [Dermacentor silvarum]|uniref:uncharacterized protein LOC125945371 n=1 Tax=Dermacentor silvarum TaxID=543639 RepID=UPI002101A9A4|nr:uncharacterized protein LOC125945371 [Dermacentor silvarum]
MKLVLLIALFTGNFSFLAASCPENEESVYCDGSYLVPQVYCGGAGLDDTWRCGWENRRMCRCKAAYARETNNTCVLVENCKYGLYEHPIRFYFEKEEVSESEHKSPAHQGTRQQPYRTWSESFGVSSQPRPSLPSNDERG